MKEGGIDDITEWFDGLDREQVKAVDRVSLVLLFPLSQECFHDLFGSAKRRAPQPAECIAKIEQAALRSDIENTDGSGYGQPFAPGHKDSFTIIHEQKFGMERQGKCDSRSLPIVKQAE